jgi:hypothetical protein
METSSIPVHAYLFVIQKPAWRINSEANVGCRLVVNKWFVWSSPPPPPKKCDWICLRGLSSPMVQQPYWARTSSLSRLHDHTHTTLGSTPLDEWSARRRDLYLTTHNTHKRQTSMPLAGFKPAIPESERPQTHALDGTATGILSGHTSVYSLLHLDRNLMSPGCAACHAGATCWHVLTWCL